MRRQRCTGMTLVEVLIAFVLLGLIFALGFEALYVGSRNLQATTLATTNNSEWRQSARMLGRFLRQTQAIKVLHQDNVHRMMFNGERSRLSWVSPLGTDGVGLYQLTLQHAGDELLLSYAPLQSTYRQQQNMDHADDTNKLRLLSQVQQLRVSYYASDSVNTRAYWHNQWTDEALLPELVRLSLQHNGQDKELVFPLAISSLSNNPYQVLAYELN